MKYQHLNLETSVSENLDVIAWSIWLNFLMIKIKMMLRLYIYVNSLIKCA